MHQEGQQVCRIDRDRPDTVEDLLADPQQNSTLAALAVKHIGNIYVTDFYGGRLLLVDSGGSIATVATGIQNSNAVAADGDGTGSLRGKRCV
ncbi:hypothetical protein OG585_50170 (plasmid) [Streptomyces sp. NBC_01340]|uniref:hypothetical protein n=1 Tax=Streptomyces sp. NBC_01340 TaxID=2903830 RepID=UPI002E0EC1FA|nr:hypothetical protein OG585_50170 [Streptomyces sp. NBC_01340]